VLAQEPRWLIAIGVLGALGASYEPSGQRRQ
jgi:hypothetical protein